MPSTALFAASPLVMENATYPWTKALAAFYAVLALWFYLAGWRKNDGLRITAAFVALAAGLLAHYSLGPYCALLALHYLARVFWRRPRKWRELGVITALCGLLLATWFAWSLTTFGWKTTLQSNTSVTSSQRYGGNNLVKIGANLLDSVVPAVVRNPGLFRMFEQPSRAGFVRDVAFLSYQVSLIPAMGLVGGPLAIWLLYRAFRRRDRSRASPWRARQRSFWLWFVLCIVPLGIAVVGERDSFGVAHLTLIPMEALGITLLAAAFPWRRSMAIALLAGCAIDFGLGVYLHARIESLENAPGRTRFALVFDKDGRPRPFYPVPRFAFHSIRKQLVRQARVRTRRPVPSRALRAASAGRRILSVLVAGVCPVPGRDGRRRDLLARLVRAPQQPDPPPGRHCGGLPGRGPQHARRGADPAVPGADGRAGARKLPTGEGPRPPTDRAQRTKKSARRALSK